MASDKVNLSEGQRSWGNMEQVLPIQKGKPRAPGMHLKNTRLLLFKDGRTRHWELRHRMRGKTGFSYLLKVLNNRYMKVKSRWRHTHP